jgi:hypothetical protein
MQQIDVEKLVDIFLQLKAINLCKSLIIISVGSVLNQYWHL